MRSLSLGAAVAAMAVSACLFGAGSDYFRRQIQEVDPVQDDLSPGSKVDYRPLFGVGDASAGQMKTIVRYGEVTVRYDGSTNEVSYPNEEQIYFVEEGRGFLNYDGQSIRIGKNDFAYLPPGVPHGLGNIFSVPLKVLVMGFRIPEGVTVAKPAKPLVANADSVQLQTLPSRSPTTQFRLLMGTTASTRDKLAAAEMVNGLWIMDVAPGGTSVPHASADEEEVYFVLRGQGRMLAGKEADGNDRFLNAPAGSAFFFAPGCRAGYSSDGKEGQEHDLILAVRAALPKP